MSQVMDVGNSDNVLTMPFKKKITVEDAPSYDSFESVSEALESFEESMGETFVEGPVIDLTLDIPTKKADIQELSTVEVFLNLTQNLNNLNSVLSKMKYYLDELESIEKTVR